MARPLHRRILGVACAALAALASATASAQPQEPPAAHPFAPSQPIPGRYIVVFKDSVGNPAAEGANAMRGSGGQLYYSYSAALKGFAATLPDAAVQALRNNPNVAYVEQDQTVSLSAVENGATWGLDRIDQETRPLDLLYQYNYTGAGVTAFIIDTGIRADHVDFGGRVLSGYSVIDDGRGTNDCDGRGTHVAGTVGGTTWGVAKGVALRPHGTPVAARPTQSAERRWPLPTWRGLRHWQPKPIPRLRRGRSRRSSLPTPPPDRSAR